MANPITRYASSNSFGREIGINLTKYGYGSPKSVQRRTENSCRARLM